MATAGESFVQGVKQAVPNAAKAAGGYVDTALHGFGAMASSVGMNSKKPKQIWDRIYKEAIAAGKSPREATIEAANSPEYKEAAQTVAGRQDRYAKHLSEAEKSGNKMVEGIKGAAGAAGSLYDAGLGMLQGREKAATSTLMAQKAARQSEAAAQQRDAANRAAAEGRRDEKVRGSEDTAAKAANAAKIAQQQLGGAAGRGAAALAGAAAAAKSTSENAAQDVLNARQLKFQQEALGQQRAEAAAGTEISSNNTLQDMEAANREQQEVDKDTRDLETMQKLGMTYAASPQAAQPTEQPAAAAGEEPPAEGAATATETTTTSGTDMAFRDKLQGQFDQISSKYGLQGTGGKMPNLKGEHPEAFAVFNEYQPKIMKLIRENMNSNDAAVKAAAEKQVAALVAEFDKALAAVSTPAKPKV
jgi:hypothetical protein